MSELLRRLTHLTRAHFHDLLDRHRRRQVADLPREADSQPISPIETRGNWGLPYSDELAGHYRTLDLPFGAPLAEVNKRWKTYLKKCHPDRYASDPEKLADATQLTQELTQAHEQIKRAWEYYQPGRR